MTGATPDGPTPVTIFGRTYNLRGGGQPEHLSRLAREVDRRMREVAEATGTADTLKIAILAALNITEDFLQSQRDGAGGTDPAALDRMIRHLDEVLAETGGRSSPDAAGRVE